MQNDQFKKDTKWYKKTEGIIILLILFFPVGLYLMWKYSDWKKSAKVIVTIILACGVIGSINSREQKDENNSSITSSTNSSYSTNNDNSNAKVSEEKTKEPVKEEKKEEKKEEPKKEEKKSTEEDKKETFYTEGTYKVGNDIKEGEYKIFAKGYCYIQCAKDSTGELESIIFNENLDNETMYVTLKSGEYFKMTNGIMYPVGSEPKTSDEEISDGMYKVGTDIQPGEYKVIVTNELAYYEVSTSSRHQIEDIVTNENLTTDTYLSVQAGQYVTLKGCKLQK